MNSGNFQATAIMDKEFEQEIMTIKEFLKEIQ
jgi:hypothetical protein